MKICLALMCGLPATGKSSTICRLIVDNGGGGAGGAGGSIAVYCVCFDDLYEMRANRSGSAWNADQWKQCQDDMYRLTEHVVLWLNRGDGCETAAVGCNGSADCWMCEWCNVHIGTPTHRNIVLLIDDNMYYRSMRQRYVRLARRMRLYCCIMAIRVDNVELCLQRNAERTRDQIGLSSSSSPSSLSALVPESAIRDMFQRIEYPDASDRVDHIRIVHASDDVQTNAGELNRLIKECLEYGSPLTLHINEDEEKRLEEERHQSRLAQVNNSAYLLDIATRQTMTDIMKSESVSSLSKTQRASVAREINSARRKLLEDVKLEQQTRRIAEDQTEWIQRCVKLFAASSQLLVRHASEGVIVTGAKLSK